jgi:hypothetical protein
LGARIDGYDSGGWKWEELDVDYWKGQFWRFPGSLALSTRLGLAIAADWVAFFPEQV